MNLSRLKKILDNADREVLEELDENLFFETEQYKKLADIEELISSLSFKIAEYDLIYGKI